MRSPSPVPSKSPPQRCTSLAPKDPQRSGPADLQRLGSVDPITRSSRRSTGQPSNPLSVFLQHSKMRALEAHERAIAARLRPPPTAGPVKCQAPVPPSRCHGIGHLAALGVRGATRHRRLRMWVILSERLAIESLALDVVPVHLATAGTRGDARRLMERPFHGAPFETTPAASRLKHRLELEHASSRPPDLGSYPATGTVNHGRDLGRRPSTRFATKTLFVIHGILRDQVPYSYGVAFQVRQDLKKLFVSALDRKALYILQDPEVPSSRQRSAGQLIWIIQ